MGSFIHAGIILGIVLLAAAVALVIWATADNWLYRRKQGPPGHPFVPRAWDKRCGYRAHAQDDGCNRPRREHDEEAPADG